MKKLIATVMALLMVLTAAGTVIAEEEFTGPSYAEEHPGVEAYDGYWISEDRTTLAEIGVRQDRVEIVVYRTPGEMEFTSWEYLPEYDDSTKTLKADNGMKSLNQVAENGDLADSQYTYDDGAATFSIDADGKLTWQDEKENAGAGLRFVPIGFFEGNYQCDRAFIEFRWNEGHYAVDIRWAGSASELAVWQFVGEYHPENNTVEAQGLYQKLTYTEDGEVNPSADSEERKVSAVFSFDEDFNLIWSSPDGEGDGMVFENMLTPIYLLEF